MLTHRHKESFPHLWLKCPLQWAEMPRRRRRRRRNLNTLHWGRRVRWVDLAQTQTHLSGRYTTYAYSFSSRFHALTAILRYSQCVGTAHPFCLGTYRTKKTKTVEMGQHIPAAVEFKTGVKQQSLSHHRRRRSWGQEGREVLMRVRVLVLVVVLMELERHRRDARLVLRRPARWALRGARCCWASWSGAARRVIFSPGDAASALTLCWNNEAVISGG